jgi:hypothetical protein
LNSSAGDNSDEEIDADIEVGSDYHATSAAQIAFNQHHLARAKLDLHK